MDLTEDERTALRNALNEVLHGPDAIDACEFETRMGVRRDEAEALLRRFVDET